MSISEESDIENSDAELQDAFAKGILEPGLNFVTEKFSRKCENNVKELKKKYKEMYLDLEWNERLDLINVPAPLAPELAVQIQEQEAIRSNQLQRRKGGQPVISLENDPVMNDFKREMLFHRQAQSAVMEGISRLKTFGVPSKRPDDYFAEMAKPDAHMHKVRVALISQQRAKEVSQKAKQHRQLKKMAKLVAKEAKLKRVEEKREMLGEVKKYRKGLRKDLDFLDDKKGKQKKPKAQNFNRMQGSKKGKKKKEFKEKMYGFGGKKRGKKRNTTS